MQALGLAIRRRAQADTERQPLPDIRRKELEAGKQPMRLDGKVAVRSLYPMPVGEIVDSLSETQPLHMPAEMLDHRIGKDKVVACAADARGTGYTVSARSARRRLPCQPGVRML